MTEGIEFLVHICTRIHVGIEFLVHICTRIHVGIEFLVHTCSGLRERERANFRYICTRNNVGDLQFPDIAVPEILPTTVISGTYMYQKFVWGGCS